MDLVKKLLLVSMATGLLVFTSALAQETGGGGGAAADSGAPSYGPGTVPTLPGTDVPVPAGEGAAPAAETGADTAAPAEGESSTASGSPGTYVERRRDQVVFESSCLKCHPKEKILKRRTETQWKEIVLQKHLLKGRIFSSDAAPVLRYLNANYGIKPAAPGPTAPPVAPAPTIQPQPPAPTAQPGATAAPPPESSPAAPPQLDQ